jgi:hypothetical protein
MWTMAYGPSRRGRFAGGCTSSGTQDMAVTACQRYSLDRDEDFVFLGYL